MKGSSQQKFSYSNACRFIGIWLICFLIGQALAAAIVIGDSGTDLRESGVDLSAAPLGKLRWLLFISSMFSFVIPGLIYAASYYKKYGRQYLDFQKAINWRYILVGAFLIIVGSPFMIFAIKLNAQIELPGWMAALDSADYALLERILYMPNVFSLLINVFLVGIVAAVGEEIVFRGIIQKGLYKLVNVHVAIVLASFVFSLIHMQFDGLFGRWFLGCVMGYAFWWSKSLWVPIIIHFLNNALQVVMAYFNPDYISSVSEPELQLPDIPAYGIVLSTILILGTIVFVSRRSPMSE